MAEAFASPFLGVPLIVSPHLPFEAEDPETSERYDCHCVRTILGGREVLIVSERVAEALRKAVPEPPARELGPVHSGSGRIGA